MSDIEKAIRGVLASTAGLTALVGSRIYFYDRPQSSLLPCVVYALDTTESSPELEGNSDINIALFDIAALAETKEACTNIKNQVLLALNGLDGTYSATDICQSRDVREMTHAYRIEEGKDKVIFADQVTFRVFWKD